MSNILTAIRKEPNFYREEAADVLQAMIARMPVGSKAEGILLDALWHIEADMEESRQASDPAPDNTWMQTQDRAMEEQT